MLGIWYLTYNEAKSVVGFMFKNFKRLKKLNFRLTSHVQMNGYFPRPYISYRDKKSGIKKQQVFSTSLTAKSMLI